MVQQSTSVDEITEIAIHNLLARPLPVVFVKKSTDSGTISSAGK